MMDTLRFPPESRLHVQPCADALAHLLVVLLADSHKAVVLERVELRNDVPSLVKVRWARERGVLPMWEDFYIAPDDNTVRLAAMGIVKAIGRALADGTAPDTKPLAPPPLPAPRVAGVPCPCCEGRGDSLDWGSTGGPCGACLGTKVITAERLTHLVLNQRR